MKRMVATIIVLAVLMSALMCPAFAVNEGVDDIYSSIYIAEVVTKDENGNEVSFPISLRDCEYFDTNGNTVDVSEAITLTPANRASDVLYLYVTLNSGYMIRNGDYWCTLANQVTLSCKLGSSAKVAFGYSYTANPDMGAEVYTATTDKKTHSHSFYVPYGNTYYMFYCTNISPIPVVLETFTISY